MTIPVECKYCGKNMTVGTHVGGKRFRCPGCLEIIEAPLPASPEPKFRPEPISQTRPASPPVIKPSQPAPYARQVTAKSGPHRPRHSPRTATSKPAVDASALWSVSSYDYPEAPMPERIRTDQQDLRTTHPELFEEYDRVVSECAMFLMGFGVIMAALFSVLYFGDSAPSNPERHKNIFIGAMVISGSCVAAGLFCLTRWHTMLIMVAIMSAMFGGFIVILGLLFGKVLLVPGIGMCIVCFKLISAVLKYPSAR